MERFCKNGKGESSALSASQGPPSSSPASLPGICWKCWITREPGAAGRRSPDVHPAGASLISGLLHGAGGQVGDAPAKRLECLRLDLAVAPVQLTSLLFPRNCSK